MATTRVTPVQLLRSEVLNKRPDPSKLLPGQGAVNINAAQPGFFFADDTGNTLFKVGPCTVDTVAPNTGASGSPGQVGNTLGELWFDISNPLVPALKVYDGTKWMYASPPTLISDTVPTLGSYPDNTLWWDSSTGLMYILYYGGSSRQWTQISSNTVS